MKDVRFFKRGTLFCKVVDEDVYCLFKKNKWIKQTSPFSETKLLLGDELSKDDVFLEIIVGKVIKTTLWEVKCKHL